MNNHLTIHKLGPIDHCELSCSHFMTFTGFQASGKSTIAKAIFFFRTIKDDIIKISEQRALGVYDERESKMSLKALLLGHLREKFLRVFGSSWAMDNEMSLRYDFTDTIWIQIRLVESAGYHSPNYIWIDLSEDLVKFLQDSDRSLDGNPFLLPEQNRMHFIATVFATFGDIFEVVYIPAGRSMLSLLSQQLNYIYSTMKDSQKRMLDYCTQDYIERILRIKPEFSEGIDGIYQLHDFPSVLEIANKELAVQLTSKILRGSYCYTDGDERIDIGSGRYVKINFASSGQQEAVWIANLILYYLYRKRPVLFIIEEPESNLFPESQKYMSELIALASNCGHSVLLTTHSPYVLGTLNNLLFAHQTDIAHTKQADQIISDKLWIDHRVFDAYFVSNGAAERCMDDEIHLIENERIDGISKAINNDFDRLLDLRPDEGV